jgi:protein-tyrosine phosphatase
VLGKRPDAVRVVPGLWVGSCPNRRQAHHLAAEGINCAVDLRTERDAESPWPDGVILYGIPMEDHGSPTVEELESAAAAVAGLVRQGHEVMVHCRAGLERGPTVVCAVLVLQGWSLREAHDRVMQCRPGAAPTEGQLAALRGMSDSRLAAAAS